MAHRAPSLSVKQLMEVFGVSHVTLYNWTRDGAFPAVGERTAGAVSRWASRHKKPIVTHPVDVLMQRKTPSNKLTRTATGRLTSAKAPARKSSYPVATGKKNPPTVAGKGGGNSPTKASRAKPSSK